MSFGLPDLGALMKRMGPNRYRRLNKARHNQSPNSDGRNCRIWIVVTNSEQLLNIHTFGVAPPHAGFDLAITQITAPDAGLRVF
jgi:hypothetical protein